MPSLYNLNIGKDGFLVKSKTKDSEDIRHSRTLDSVQASKDYYDYLFYIGKGSKFNIKYLENKLKNTGGKIDDNETLTLEKVKDLLKEKFEATDYESAKEDVSNFIVDKASLNLWKK